jgi:hypothetical protein
MISDSNGDLQPTDRMRKISPLVTQLRERFQSVIIPEDVCIDGWPQLVEGFLEEA